MKALESFKSGALKVMVATDVAGRLGFMSTE